MTAATTMPCGFCHGKGACAAVRTGPRTIRRACVRCAGRQPAETVTYWPAVVRALLALGATKNYDRTGA